MECAIETRGLRRTFGGVVAEENLDLRVEPAPFRFFGPNGARKSTTIRMLTGLLAPASHLLEERRESLGEAVQAMA